MQEKSCMLAGAVMVLQEENVLGEELDKKLDSAADYVASKKKTCATSINKKREALETQTETLACDVQNLTKEMEQL